MTNSPRKTDVAPEPDRSSKDEDSRIRERADSSQRLRRRSDPNISLDERLEAKLAEANAFLVRLEPQDARARLLHIAMLRRDESLLDGILAELAIPAPSRRSR
jgi:hypothetical protein